LTKTPTWRSVVVTSPASTTLTLRNFTSILKTSQFTFYLPLVTPLLPQTYSLTLKAFRASGQLAQIDTKSIIINQTTGYIR
jgi:hypothetical protein